MASLEQEHLRVLLLNTRNQVLNIQEIYVGNVNSAVVRPAEVLRPAVRENAPGIIVVHNHPSGDPTPSAEDVAVTSQIAQACKLLGIDLLDHLVIGSANRFVSLKERHPDFTR
jgi:DNA repair protein RadC